jgi:hypothetical protein
MPDKREEIQLEITTGATQPNLEQMKGGVDEVNAAGKNLVATLTPTLEQVEQATGQVAGATESAAQSFAAEADAAQASAQAIGEVAGSAAEIAPALDAATEGMSNTSTAAQETATGIAAVGAASAEVADEVETLGASAEEATSKIADGAETAKTALDGIAPSAEAAAAAVEQMGESGERAALPLPDVTRGMTSVKDAAANMATTVKAAWDIDAEGGKLSARQLATVVQNRERLRQAIVEEFGSLEAADGPTRAVYEAWDAEVQRLVVHTQELTKAQRAAAVGLKEGGEQFAMVGLLAEHVGKNFGEVGEKLGIAAGELGLLASVGTHLGRVFAGLKLNELGGGFAKVSIQAALVAATAVAAAAAGKKLSETNEANAQTIDFWEKALVRLGGSLKTDLIDLLNGVQNQVDLTAGSILSFAEGLGHVPLEQSAHELQDVNNETTRLGVAFAAGATGVGIYNAAVEAGIDKEKAAALAKDYSRYATENARLALVENEKGEKSWQETAEKSITIHEFYAQAAASGAEGQKILREVIRESEGDTNKMALAMLAYKDALDAATRAEEALRVARALTPTQLAAVRHELDQTVRILAQLVPKSDEYATALGTISAKLTEIVSKNDGLSRAERERILLLADLAKHADTLSASQRENAKALAEEIINGKAASAAVNDLIRADAGFTQATHGSTAAINEKLDAIDALLPKSDKYSEALKQLVSELLDLAAHTNYLSEAERDRIAIIAQLVGKAETLTESQRVYVNKLIDSVLAQQKASGAANDMARAIGGLDQAVRGSTTRINDNLTAITKLIAESPKYAPVLASLSSELKKSADNTYGLSARERERIEVITQLTARSGTLTASERQYVLALASEVQAGKAAVESAQKQVAAFANLQTAIANVNKMIEEQTKSALPAQETAMQQAVRTAQQALDTNKMLTASERAQYQAIVDTQRAIALLQEKQALLEAQNKSTRVTADELLTSERSMTTELDHNAESAHKDAVAHGELATALEHDTTATQNAVRAEQSLTVVHGNNVVALREELRVTQEAIKLGLARGQNVTTLVAAEAQLARQIAAVSAETAKATEVGRTYTVWKAEDEKSVQVEIDLQKQRLKQLTEQVDVSKQVQTSANALTVTYKDGVATLSNIEQKTDAVTDSIKKSAQEITDDKKFWDDFDAAIARSGGTTLPRFGEEITVTAEKVGKTTKTIADHAAEVLRTDQAYRDMGEHAVGAFGDLAGQIDAVNEKLGVTAKKLSAVKSAVDSIDKTGDSGSAITVNEH